MSRVTQKLRFHWMLPKGGEIARQTASPYVVNRSRSLAGQPDMEGWTDFAQCAETAGIESVLLSFGHYEPDTLMVACALGRATQTLKFIAAYRLGLMQPTTFVQQVNTLSHLIEGRLALNIVAGSLPAEQRGYGDFLDHDQRYARAAEFLTVCHAFWRNKGQADFKGHYYYVEGGNLHTPFWTPDPDKPGTPEIYVAGHSSQAQTLAQTHGSCWLRVIDAPEALDPAVTQARAQGTDVCLRTCIVCRPTRKAAIQAAERLKAEESVKQRVQRSLASSDSQMFQSSLAAAEGGDWRGQCLWTGLVKSHGPSAMTMVGTPAELAAAFEAYRQIGVTQFIISGWPKLEEMEIFGRDVLPLIRANETAA